MKRITQLLFISVAIIFTSLSFAETVVSNGNNVYVYNVPPVVTSPGKGFYVGTDLGGGVTKCNNCSTTATLTASSQTSTSNNGAMADLFGGYQFNPYFAVEFGFGSLPSVKIEQTATTEIPPFFIPATYTSTRYAYTSDVYLALKGMLPLTNQFSLFGKLGIASEQVSYNNWFTDNDVNINATGTYLALGASYYFSPHWAGLASLNRVHTANSGTTFESNYFSLGFSYLIF